VYGGPDFFALTGVIGFGTKNPIQNFFGAMTKGSLNLFSTSSTIYGISPNTNGKGFLVSGPEVFMSWENDNGASWTEELVSNSHVKFQATPGSILRTSDGSLYMAGCLSSITPVASYGQLVKLNPKGELTIAQSTSGYYTKEIPFNFSNQQTIPFPMSDVTILLGDFPGVKTSPTQTDISTATSVTSWNNNALMPTLAHSLSTMFTDTLSAELTFDLTGSDFINNEDKIELVDVDAYPVQGSGIVYEQVQGIIFFSFEHLNMIKLVAISGTVPGTTAGMVVELSAVAQNPANQSANLLALSPGVHTGKSRYSMDTVGENVLVWCVSENSITVDLNYQDGNQMWAFNYTVDTNQQTQAFVAPYDPSIVAINGTNSITLFSVSDKNVATVSWTVQGSCSSLGYNMSRTHLHCMSDLGVSVFELSSGKPTSYFNLTYKTNNPVGPGLMAFKIVENSLTAAVYLDPKAKEMTLVVLEQDHKSVKFATQYHLENFTEFSNIDVHYYNNTGIYVTSFVSSTTSEVVFLACEKTGVVAGWLAVEVDTPLGGFYHQGSGNFFAIGKSGLGISAIGGTPKTIDMEVSGYNLNLIHGNVLNTNLNTFIATISETNVEDMSFPSTDFLLITVNNEGELSSLTNPIVKATSKAGTGSGPLFITSLDVSSSISISTAAPDGLGAVVTAGKIATETVTKIGDLAQQGTPVTPKATADITPLSGAIDYTVSSTPYGLSTWDNCTFQVVGVPSWLTFTAKTHIITSGTIPSDAPAKLNFSITVTCLDFWEVTGQYQATIPKTASDDINVASATSPDILA